MVRSVVKIIVIALALIALYLVLAHATGFDGTIGALASGSVASIGALQGRNVSIGNASIS